VDAIRRHPWRTVTITVVALLVLLSLAFVLLIVGGESQGGTGFGPPPG
jgi:hypothetical protein